MTRVVVDNGGSDWLTPLATLLAVVVGGLVNWVPARATRDARDWRPIVARPRNVSLG
jgi:hypothetical protein